ncbi:hypothetical protein EMIHUDRAFT_235093 [Emiliania huxleyi CCMP1516]|uniref:ShKT domain-containing protein n=2 Tax=Emiliania huxleyi TaxID=2903 RepID=A0A0D3JXB9_EMIH1|nr:hypothetical protein EMIHUDRAFT_235093 [Emiliania huxleyi CCMP1516]EOD28154.1 hypothetical protein EMIHUDRAFT_235093 [Emiliania huxleyi CCMP1516]|eukprot:XP_005780583.1 hypothetical protein EMIHUDRAFT_235093 [Emiliania huxleyi CCMP1516]
MPLAPILAALPAASRTPAGGDSCTVWADAGECSSNPTFMLQNCAAACEVAGREKRELEECAGLIAGAGCRSEPVLARCGSACFLNFSASWTPDREGNCWYWATDGECDANPAWMESSCPRSCSKLRACAADPASDACSEPFECPLSRDRAGDCTERALRGECRGGGGAAWRAHAALSACSLSCHLLDPPSTSHTATRPLTRSSPLLDPPRQSRGPARCSASRALSLLSGERQRRQEAAAVPGRDAARSLEAWVTEGVLDASSTAGPAPEPSVPRLETISATPRVRLLHDFAAALIALSEPLYHRSSTARATGDDKRTSFSATLPSSNSDVAAVRRRIARYSGYPEANLEPLQTACETWYRGNRHFTFLIYLSDVAAGGDTNFPRLNITVPPTPLAALVFDNCLRNGEPDERTLHEGIEPSGGAVKYAINGWMRSRPISSL